MLQKAVAVWKQRQGEATCNASTLQKAVAMWKQRQGEAMCNASMLQKAVAVWRTRSRHVSMRQCCRRLRHCGNSDKVNKSLHFKLQPAENVIIAQDRQVIPRAIPRLHARVTPHFGFGVLATNSRYLYYHLLRRQTVTKIVIQSAAQRIDLREIASQENSWVCRLLPFSQGVARCPLPHVFVCVLGGGGPMAVTLGWAKPPWAPNAPPFFLGRKALTRTSSCTDKPAPFTQVLSCALSPHVLVVPGAVIVPAAVLAAEAAGQRNLAGRHHHVEGLQPILHTALVQQAGHHGKQLRIT
jgi:hypothetical protein